MAQAFSTALRSDISEVLLSYGIELMTKPLQGTDCALVQVAGSIAEFLHTMGASRSSSAMDTLTVSAAQTFDWHKLDLQLGADGLKELDVINARTADVAEYFTMPGGFRFSCKIDVSALGYKSIHPDLALPLQVALLLPKLLLLGANCKRCVAGSKFFEGANF